MGLKRSRWLPRNARGAWALAALLLAAAAFDAVRLQRGQRLNASIAETVAAPSAALAAAASDSGAGTASSPLLGEPLPEQRFARAHAEAATGKDAAALNHYRALHADTALGRSARFNGANMLVRQALAARTTAQPGQAVALLELAKEGYREVLRQQPQHWDARYNLERAQRLLPDPEDAEEQATAASRERERAPTTMRSQSLGLP